ncbi:GPALPP motifs-containing protein 1-like isoform X2 [Homarus americanus]|uniref:GPALPP motifs-containing protein 1-like isoform X2 n=1 Tax=Homarus americanus TaxID=6706 RepID=UPI001C4739F9|nr:GPALPP motifs-containing protein 1-like isoform X2 [Homarus americanus]
MSDSDSDIDSYGPPLPPGMGSGSHKKNKVATKTPSDDTEDLDEDDYMPDLPPHLVGKKRTNNDSQSANLSDTSVSQNLQRQNLKRTGEVHTEHPQSKAAKPNQERTPDIGSDDDDDMYVPALPPHLLNKKQEKATSCDNRRILGPTVPKYFTLPVESSNVSTDGEENSESEDSDGPVIGPLPSTQKFSEEEYRIRQLELRAKRMKDKLEGKDADNKPLVRESWMLELPEDKPNFCGLAPRQFLRKTPQVKGDRSGWTDTPADKARKMEMGKEEEQQELTPELIASKQRDKELSEKVDKHNQSKRAKPLIDMHKKKLKETKKKSGPEERRPFSREEDMNVNKFDDAQKNTIIKKARQLNDRFSAGGRKFL